MTPRRLALLGLSPGPGGVGRVICDLLEGLHGLGIEVDLLLPDGDFPELDRLESTRPRRFSLPGDDPRRAAGSLLRYLEAERPAAILSNRDGASALLTASLDPRSRPWMVFRVGSDLSEKARRRGLIRRFSYLREIRRIYVHADALIGNSRGVVDSLRRLLGDTAPPLHRIPNPRDLALIERLAAGDDAHPWCLDSTLPVVMSIGRLVAAKDFETLIRAFALLRERLPARLLILGELGQSHGEPGTCPFVRAVLAVRGLAQCLDRGTRLWHALRGDRLSQRTTRDPRRGSAGATGPGG